MSWMLAIRTEQWGEWWYMWKDPCNKLQCLKWRWLRLFCTHYLPMIVLLVYDYHNEFFVCQKGNQYERTLVKIPCYLHHHYRMQWGKLCLLIIKIPSKILQYTGAPNDQIKQKIFWGVFLGSMQCLKTVWRVVLIS